MRGHDTTLLVAVKRSKVYRAIRSRIADPLPQDAWTEGGTAFVVFALRPLDEGEGESTTNPPARVFFVLGALTGILLAARLVESGTSGEWQTHELCDTDGDEVSPTKVNRQSL